jgi:hypothetical protein
MQNRIDDAGKRKPTSGAPSHFWHKLKRGIIRGEKELNFLKGAAIVSVLGTLIGAYFQNLSAYEDKVSTQAQDDLKAATDAFTEASVALSTPLSLQERVVFGYFDSLDQGVDKKPNAYVAKNARALSAPYESAYTDLRERIDLLARRVEIYLDWPSDRNHDAANNVSPIADPINRSAFGTYSFDCDNDMPNFTRAGSRVKLFNKDRTDSIELDWYSAKHNVLAIYYCFNLMQGQIRPIREWGANITLDPAEQRSFNEKKKDIESRLTKQIVRLNAFLGLAMNSIDQIRAKYRPHGYVCSVPGVRELMGRRCTPVRLAGQ